MLGTTKMDTPQFGHIAVATKTNKKVGICLNLIQCIVIYGLQNHGKSVSVQVFLEMLTQRLAQISKVKKPHGVIYCHYDQGNGYPPSISKALLANSDPNHLTWLRKTFGMRVKPLMKGAKAPEVKLPADRRLQKAFEKLEKKIAPREPRKE